MSSKHFGYRCLTRYWSGIWTLDFSPARVRLAIDRSSVADGSLRLSSPSGGVWKDASIVVLVATLFDRDIAGG